MEEEKLLLWQRCHNKKEGEKIIMSVTLWDGMTVTCIRN